MRKFSLLLISVLFFCSLLLSGCSIGNLSFFSTVPPLSEDTAAVSSDYTSSDSTSSTASSLPNQETLYAQIAQTNTIDNVLSQYERVSQDIIYYDNISNSTSDDYSIFVYADENTMAQEDSNGNVLFMEKDKSGGFSADMNTAYRHLFVGKSLYQDYWEGTREFILFTDDWNSGETVTDLKTDGESYIITTEISSEDVEGDSIVNVYTVDTQTLFVQSMTCSLKHSNGSSDLVCECTLHYNADPYEPSAVLLNQVFGTGRYVTVIADPDTEQEQTYSVQVLPGIFVQICLDSCYTNLYEDRACTIEHPREDTPDPNSNSAYDDCTYYVCIGK